MRVCVLSSGSKGNSTYVEIKNHKILIDIGTSSLYIEKSLRQIDVEPSSIDLVLITHAHIDHVKGLKVFNKKYKPRVYITDKILKESNLERMDFKIIDDLKDIEDIKINEVPLSHDVSDIKGYVIEDTDDSMVYITDTGYISEKNFKLIKNKNIYVFESNHDVEKLMNNDKYPHHTKIRILSDKGHLSNVDSSYYLTKIIGDNTKYIILSHLSEQNNTEDLAIKTLKNELKKHNITNKKVLVARQNELTEILKV